MRLTDADLFHYKRVWIKSDSDYNVKSDVVVFAKEIDKQAGSKKVAQSLHKSIMEKVKSYHDTVFFPASGKMAITIEALEKIISEVLEV